MTKLAQPENWPEDHPISIERAKQLIEGPLGTVYNDIALSSAAPILWFSRSSPAKVLHSGTLTAVRTPKRIFGITAAHVLQQYESDYQEGEVCLQLKNEVMDRLRIIDSCPRRDLATFELDEEIIQKLDIQPLTWPPRPPMEGRGLLLAGFPANTKIDTGAMTMDWIPFSSISTARTVTEDQITILVPRNEWVKNSLPPNCELGGVSGGPIIGIFETEAHVAHHSLSGIITEHPDYSGSDFTIERIVGARADAITEFGKIR
jgi:hypothetical protein